MEEALVHRSVVKNTKRSAVGIGQNRFAAEFARDRSETLVNFAERLVPAGSFKVVGASRARAFGHPQLPPHGIETAPGRIDAVEILRLLRAKQSLRPDAPGRPEFSSPCHLP